MISQRERRSLFAARSVVLKLRVVAPAVTYSASEAVVKIRIGDERLISAAEGNGLVNERDRRLGASAG